MFSTRQAAKKLGLGAKTLSHYIAVGKVPSPQILKVGSASLHAWTEEDMERVRKLLPKIANGRKTRYMKKESEVRSQESEETKQKQKKQSGDRSQESEKAKAKAKTKAKSPPPRATVPHKQRRKK